MHMISYALIGCLVCRILYVLIIIYSNGSILMVTQYHYNSNTIIGTTTHTSSTPGHSGNTIRKRT